MARDIASLRDSEVHLIGFPGCYPNAYAERMMQRLCTHPNVGAVLLVSLGCESFNRDWLEGEIDASGRPVHTLAIQETGGTTKPSPPALSGCSGPWTLRRHAYRPMALDELVVGTICGGSDGTSGLTANPAVGRAFDPLVAAGAACIFEETGELIGCEPYHGGPRRHVRHWARKSCGSMEKAARYYATLGYGSFAVGNADGGLTTIEEKSLGAYAKSGASAISGLLKPGDLPPAGRGGLYLLDVVPDGEVRYGFPNINDNAELAELIACGAHLILFTTGRGSVVGSAISPVLKVCANPETFRALEDDMDIDAGRILEGAASLDEVGQRDRRRGAGPGPRRAQQVRRAGPPGIHPYLQGLRADRAGLPAAGAAGARAGDLSDGATTR